MLDALGHVILGTRRDGPTTARTQDGSDSKSEVLLVTPRTCIEDCPQISNIRGTGCGALRSRMPVFRAFSTLLGYNSIVNTRNDSLHSPNYTGLLTSTWSRTAITTTSRPEFRQPTTTPGTSDVGMSIGQNTLINPSCSGMADGAQTSERLQLEGPSAPELFSSGDTKGRRSRMLRYLFILVTFSRESSKKKGLCSTRSASTRARCCTGRKTRTKARLKRPNPCAARTYSLC